jgi:putative sporulation protein YtxC
VLLQTIVFEKETCDIMDEINDMKEHFQEKNILLGISESINLGTHFVKVFCNDLDFSEKLKGRFNLYISNILYKMAIEEFCRDEIQHFLLENYFFLRYDEMKEVTTRVIKILRNEEKITDEDMVYCMNKKNDIITKIKACIDENQEINIQGFITFRMKDLREELEDITNRVLEKYMAEKEYNEFIKLLKYFVDIQESKIEIINIIIKSDGSYEIHDKNGNDIMNEIFNNLTDTKYSDSVSVEDLIISGLITYCPENIIIHGKENCTNKEILDTIQKVFEERVEFCGNCKVCNAVKETVKI